MNFKIRNIILRYIKRDIKAPFVGGKRSKKFPDGLKISMFTNACGDELWTNTSTYFIKVFLFYMWWIRNNTRHFVSTLNTDENEDKSTYQNIAPSYLSRRRVFPLFIMSVTGNLPCNFLTWILYTIILFLFRAHFSRNSLLQTLWKRSMQRSRSI